jgi:ribosomal protein L15E
VKVIYGRNNLPFSLLIRLFTWSRWSHCGIVVDDVVIESTFSKGVTRTKLEEFIARYKSTELCEIPHSKGWLERANNQVGKKYDKLAVIGVFFRGGWDKKNKWFCSELVAYASGIYRHDRVNRVTPEDIYKISKEVK